MRRAFGVTAAAVLMAVLVGQTAFAQSQTNKGFSKGIQNNAEGGAGGHGGHGGKGVGVGVGIGHGGDSDQSQGQSMTNNIEGDDTETTVTTVTTPSVNPTVVCAQAVNVGVGVLGAGGSAGFSYTDEDCNDREWARIGLESQDVEIQAIAKDLLTRALKSRLADRYPVAVRRFQVLTDTGEVVTKVETVAFVPDWCHARDTFGMNARDKRICSGE